MMDINHDKTEDVALFGNGKTLTLKLPFVDRFGQYAHDDWPEKVRGASEFPKDLRNELAVLDTCPATWDRFGGCAAGPKREATGHFRTEKVDGRWWLIDPLGNLFFSWGIDVLRHYTDNSFGPAHPDWYETPPPKNGWMSFTHWNLRMKFDKEDYLADYYDFILRRLDSWGVNTIGRWSAWQLAMRSQKPYLVHLFDRAPKVPMLNNVDFYDCLHPAFEKNLCAAVEAQKREQAVTRAVDDPMCIGIAVGNELDFTGLFKQLPYDKALQSVERFFATCQKAVRQLAPSKLYFACPFTEFDQPPVVWDIAARYADVLSANVRTRDVKDAAPRGESGPIDAPVLIGAFNFGCIDRGLFSAGYCPAASQAERALSMRRFVAGALENPLFVGCHWFQYRDQPLVGRQNGECFQIGFVDVCDRPYNELVEASRRIGEGLYAPESLA